MLIRPAIPTPPAIKPKPGPSSSSIEKTPCGPSTYTVVPGASSPTWEVKSPSALTASSTSSRSALDANENGCCVREKGERPKANQPNCPGAKRNAVPDGGLSVSVVVSPRSAATRSRRQGRASARRGLISRTQTSKRTNAPDMKPQRICFQRLLTYSSTKKTCPSAPTISTSANTV